MTPEELLGIRERATEETLQSIDNTLKRIEIILHEITQTRFSVLDGRDSLAQRSEEN